MRILVTGANGFVGRHLVKNLSEQHDVVAVIRQETTIPGAAENRVVSSIDSTTDWSGLLGDVDVVVHAAARVHVMKETAADPLEEFLEVNAKGTQRLAEACVEQGVRRLVYLSSIKVNGEGRRGNPYTSSDLPSPVDPYGVSKWEAEQALRDLSREKGSEIVILRPTVIYGPGVKGNIERIAKLVDSGLPLPFGFANNRRSVLSVSNLVIWVEHAMWADTPGFTTVLISDPDPVSTRLLASAIAEGMRARSRMVSVPLGLMEAVAGLAGKRSVTDRLFGDLEITPDFGAFPGIREDLAESVQQLRGFGESFSRKRPAK